MSNQRIIPQIEIDTLISIILESFQNQYQKTVDPNTVTSQFIPARVNTRIGFEVNTTIENSFLKIRLYAENFYIVPAINPYRVEEIINQANAEGIQVFVSISDLPLSAFPNLSQTLNPAEPGQGVDGIELEDGTGFIQAETGENLQVETATG